MADLSNIDDVDDGENEAPHADGTATVVDVDPTPGFISMSITGNMQGGLVG